MLAKLNTIQMLFTPLSSYSSNYSTTLRESHEQTSRVQTDGTDKPPSLRADIFCITPQPSHGLCRA